MSLLSYFLDCQERLQEEYGNNAVVFMQVGDFYEHYQKNNIGKVHELSESIGYNKSSTINKKGETKYTVGFPYDGLSVHLSYLMNKRYTVAIYDQFDSEFNSDKKVRNLVGVYTPSTFIDDNYESGNLMCIHHAEYKCPIKKRNVSIINYALINITLNEIYFQSLYDITSEDYIYDIFNIVDSYNVTEIILDINDKTNFKKISQYNKKISVNTLEYIKEYFNTSYQEQFLSKIYSNDSEINIIEYLGLNKYSHNVPIILIGLEYVNKLDKRILNKIKIPKLLNCNKYLNLSQDALTQLNIISNNNDLSLIKLLNKTNTTMGKRLFSERLMLPIVDIDELNKRYEITQLFIDNEIYSKVKIPQICDFDKILKKMISGRLRPREFATMNVSLINTKQLFLDLITLFDGTIFINIYNLQLLINKIDDFMNVYNDTFNVKNMSKSSRLMLPYFNENKNKAIDENNYKINNMVNTINFIGNKLSELIDIKKVAKPSVTTVIKEKKYFYKISKCKYDKLPKEFSINFKHFGKDHQITHEDMNTFSKDKTIQIFFKKVDNLSNHIKKLSQNMSNIMDDEYYKIIYNYGIDYSNMFNELTKVISEIDVYYTSAKNANMYGYIKPTIVKNCSSSFVYASEMRHPLLERIIEDIQYVPNDVNLGKIPESIKSIKSIESIDDNTNNIHGMILYGINMSGKSSYIRSVGLNIVLAQSGMFVPCKSFNYYPYNTIISKISINDRPLKGLSSFAVELLDINTITLNMNSKTLVLSDEMFSSTETLSAHGLVAGLLSELSSKGTNFIFATHLHKIQDIDIIKNDKNIQIYHFNVDTDKLTKKFVFDRKLCKGGVPDLYGLEIASNFGVNNNVMKVAYEIRNDLQNEKNNILSTKKSRYNKKLFVDSCFKCGSIENLHTHHILQQKDADINTGLIDNRIHKNNKSNLMILCEECHHLMHSN